MRIGDICTREVVTCSPGASVAELAVLMREHHVGDVIVVESSGDERIPVGIVTDRDVAVKVVARRVDPDMVTARDIMNEVVTVLESEVVYDAIWSMRRKGVRRLPVVDGNNALFGLLSADDLVQFLAEELTELARVSPRQRQDEQDRLETTRG